MKFSKNLLLPWLRPIVIAISCTVLFLAIVAHRWERQYNRKLMTLSEALWVTDSNLTHFYGPGTPESLKIAAALSKSFGFSNERRFDAFVLWRGDLDLPRGPADVLSFEPFDPARLPAKNKKVGP